jgi:hypothetical protein
MQSLLNSLRKEQKVNIPTKKTQYFPTIIVGDTPQVFQLAQKILETKNTELPQEQVCLVHPYDFFDTNLLEILPPLLQAEKKLNFIPANLEQFSVSGEQKYHQNHYLIHQSIDKSNLPINELLNKIHLKVIIKEIQWINEPDEESEKSVIKKNNWRIKTSDGNILECQDLYWDLSFKSFYNFLQKDSFIPSEVHAFFSQITHNFPTTIIFSLKSYLKLNLSEKELGTSSFLFSQTHDQGHFFVTAFPFDEVTKVQRMVLMMRVDENSEMDPEIMSQKMKNAERILRKNFTHLKKAEDLKKVWEREFVIISDKIPLKPLGEIFSENPNEFIKKFLPALHFISH